MCGICGSITLYGPSHPDATKRMNSALHHRGPDSEGYFSYDHINIGMRRLAIIDVANGKQPLYNEDKTISLIANGEIYNFIELQEELALRGHVFATKSDCETIIHAYEEYGDGFIEKLRGMFAFCLVDTKSGRVILARDRLGEKPLYLYENGKEVLFSSELKSLLKELPSAQRTLNSKSLHSYFLHGYIIGNETMIKEVRKLPPGHIISIDTKDGKVSEKSYWNLLDSPNLKEEPERVIRNELDEIEKIIIRSDVPVGVSLSGGLDSSVITSLAAKYSKQKLHAFTVGYSGMPENDERRAARELADHLGLTFHEVEVSGNDFVHDLPKLAEAMDEPIADIAGYGYYAVSRAARKSGVLVLLAGFGADELFWGYPWVREAVRLNLKKGTFIGKTKVFFSLVNAHAHQMIRKPAVLTKIFSSLAYSDSPIMYELTPQWLYIKKNERDIFTPEFIASNKKTSTESVSNWDNSPLIVSEKLASGWLLSNCIDLGDRMSMAHSVELRLPLLDYKLFEKVIGLRKEHMNDYKLGYKYWLIQAIKTLLPENVMSRKKRGFTPPTNTWVKEASDTYRKHLLDGYLVRNQIMRKAFMEKALSVPEKNLKFLYTALVFELWAAAYLS
jgi:asparagine synthase (glutamine-hydrolysing)